MGVPDLPPTSALRLQLPLPHPVLQGALSDVTWGSGRWAGPGAPILTYQDSRVLVGGVEGALAFPLCHLVLRDGQQVGILEFLEWGRERLGG